MNSTNTARSHRQNREEHEFLENAEKTQDECDFGWRSASSAAISGLLSVAALAAEVNCRLP
jgi:hypothetical protein